MSESSTRGMPESTPYFSHTESTIGLAGRGTASRRTRSRGTRRPTRRSRGGSAGSARQASVCSTSRAAERAGRRPDCSTRGRHPRRSGAHVRDPDCTARNVVDRIQERLAGRPDHEVAGERDLVRGALENVHEVARGVGEDDDVADRDAARESAAAASVSSSRSMQYAPTRIALDRVRRVRSDAPPARRPQQQRVDEEVIRGRAALRAVHREADQPGAVATLLAELDAGGREPAAVDERRARARSAARGRGRGCASRDRLAARARRAARSRRTRPSHAPRVGCCKYG